MNKFYPSQLLLFIFNTHDPMKDSTTDKFSWYVNIRKHLLWPEKKSKNYYKNSTWFKSNSALDLDLIHLSLLMKIVLSTCTIFENINNKHGTKNLLKKVQFIFSDLLKCQCYCLYNNNLRKRKVCLA